MSALHHRRHDRPALAMTGIRWLVLPAALILTAAVAVPAQAQTPERWSVELRAGAGVGDYEPASAGSDFTTDFAWSAALGFAATPRFTVLAGYSRTGFGCRKGFCEDRDVAYTGAGADIGVEVHARPHRSTPWLRASALYHELQTSWDVDGTPSEADSDFALGLELAGGWLLRTSGRLALNPGIRFGTYEASFPGPESGRVNQIAGELGVRYAF